MRIYITGLSGMLGQALAFIHRKRGDEVFGSDIWPRHKDVSLIDIRDNDILTAHMLYAKPDRVYHCAAMLGVANTEMYPELCDQINIDGTESVLKAARSAGVGDFVLLSSSEVYGNQDEPLTENHALLGKNVYAIGKMRAEQLVRAYSHDFNSTATCRMFNCFGVGQVAKFFIPKAIALARNNETIPLFGDVDNKRSYLFGHDAAIHIAAVADASLERNTVNIAHPTTHTLLEVGNMILSGIVTNSKLKLVTKNYDDRSITRDIPNRVAVIDRLRTYSKHTPMDLAVAMRLAIATANQSPIDWEYSRELRA